MAIDWLDRRISNIILPVCLLVYFSSTLTVSRTEIDYFNLTFSYLSSPPWPYPGTCEVTLQGHTSDVTCVIELADGRLCSASKDDTIKVMNCLIIEFNLVTP